MLTEVIEPKGAGFSCRFIANPLIETLSQVILDAFASCGRITAYPEVIPQKCGSVRIGDNPPKDPKDWGESRLETCIGLKSTVEKTS